MKYLVAVDDCFLDRPGGMGRVAWDIAQAARDNGHEVAMLCFRLPNQKAPPKSEYQGIRIVRCPKPVMPKWHPHRGERSVAAATETALQELAATQWDVVHIHSLFSGAGAMNALGNRPQYVYTMHSPVVLEQQINWKNDGLMGRLKLLFGMRWLRGLEFRLMDGSHKIHVLSNYSRQCAEHFHGLGNRAQVIPHWVRPELQRTMSRDEARAQLGWPLDKKILFTVRRLGPRYGLDLAIRAVAPLAQTHDCEFYIGGDGELRPKLQRIIAKLGQTDRIHLMGRLTDDQLILAYQAADLFVLPTRSLECFGLISTEAFAFGCPVIATDVGAIPEVVAPLLPNCLVPPGDVKALQHKIEEFLTGHLNLPNEGEIISYVHRHYGREVVVPRLLELIECGDQVGVA